MRSAALVALCSLGAAGAQARPTRPLDLLPADKLAAMAPLLRQGEMALIESRPDGRMRQVTILALVAAPPEVVREVVLGAEKYPEFIRNLTRSEVRRHPDGSFDVDFTVDYKVTRFESTNRFRPNPDGSIDEWGVHEVDDNNFRWELHGAPGGTVLAYYGYTDLLHTNGYIRSITERMPSMEHGLAVAAQLVFARSVKARAERLARPGSFPRLDVAARGPGLDFLLERGRLAVVRSTRAGRLDDISILDRAAAPRARVEGVLAAPASYGSFLEGVRQSRELRRSNGEVVYETVTEAPIFSFSTRWAMRSDGRGGIDVLGLEGDLRGAHYRWDLAPIGGEATRITFRARQDLAAASPVLFGLLFRLEPLFEHGMAVAFGLVQVIGVRARAEGRVAAR